MTTMARTGASQIGVASRVQNLTSAAPAVPIVSIVIVNYCQWQNTARLVRQLMASPEIRRGRAEVVIVENHSPRHAARRRLRRMPGVSLRCLRRNYGFAAGVNEACRLSRGSWFLLLNPDVTVGPGWLDRLLAYVERGNVSAHFGAVGLQLRDPNGALQGSVGSYPTLLSTLAGQMRPRGLRKCRIWRGKSGAAQWVTGCGLLVRRECFESIRGFDRDFFLYYEDADFCRRARSAGWSVRHEPALWLKHHHPLHQRALTPRMRLLTRHSLLVYAGKHWSSWSCLLLAAIIWMEGAVRGQLATEPKAKARFRTIRLLAVDFVMGHKRTAYRRAWRTAQAGTSSKPTQARARKAMRKEPVT